MKKEAEENKPTSGLAGYSELLMEACVEVVDETAEAQGFKKSEFAQKVWPESSPRAASSRWQAILCTRGTHESHRDSNNTPSIPGHDPAALLNMTKGINDHPLAAVIHICVQPKRLYHQGKERPRRLWPRCLKP